MSRVAAVFSSGLKSKSARSGLPSWTYLGVALSIGLASCGEGTIISTDGDEPATLVLMTTELPDAVLGAAYSEALAAMGGDTPYAWTMAGGSLPTGLSLSAAGTVSGTPGNAGTSTFTVQVASADGQTATRELSITVTVSALTLVTTALPGATQNVAYSTTLEATGGEGGYVWSVTAGALPAGLDLSAAGTISGTPGTVGTGTFTVQVGSTDGQAATRELSITVTAPALSVTTTALPGGTQNVAYATTTLEATGGEGGFAWTVIAGSLPAGLSLAASGEITGTPTAVGTSEFTVEVTSGSQTAQAALAITIVAPTGANVLLTETFEDADVVSRGWFGNTSFTLTTEEQVSGNSALELNFPVGATLPTFGSAARILFPATESVHISYWVKYSQNWVGSGVGAHPHEFTLLTDADDMWVGPSSTHLTVAVEHNYQNGVVPRLGMSDAANVDPSQIGVDLTGITENRAAGGCNGDTDAYPGGCSGPFNGEYFNGKNWDAAGPVLFNVPGDANQNDWHFVEAFFQLNSIVGGIGQVDGVAQYWLDGTLHIDLDDVFFRTGAHPDMGFFEVLIAPFIGNGSPVDQTIWVDDLRIADGR